MADPVNFGVLSPIYNGPRQGQVIQLPNRALQQEQIMSGYLDQMRSQQQLGMQQKQLDMAQQRNGLLNQFTQGQIQQQGMQTQQMQQAVQYHQQDMNALQQGGYDDYLKSLMTHDPNAAAASQQAFSDLHDSQLKGKKSLMDLNQQQTQNYVSNISQVGNIAAQAKTIPDPAQRDQFWMSTYDIRKQIQPQTPLHYDDAYASAAIGLNQDFAKSAATNPYIAAKLAPTGGEAIANQAAQVNLGIATGQYKANNEANAKVKQDVATGVIKGANDDAATATTDLSNKTRLMSLLQDSDAQTGALQESNMKAKGLFSEMGIKSNLPVNEQLSAAMSAEQATALKNLKLRATPQLIQLATDSVANMKDTKDANIATLKWGMFSDQLTQTKAAFMSKYAQQNDLDMSGAEAGWGNFVNHVQLDKKGLPTDTALDAENWKPYTQEGYQAPKSDKNAPASTVQAPNSPQQGNNAAQDALQAAIDKLTPGSK